MTQRGFASLFLLMALAVSGLNGQSIQVDRTCTVRDQNGAPVPRFRDVIVNEANGATRTFTTDENGDYRAIGFFVGQYRVEFEKAGFKKQAVPGVKIEPATLRRVDADLGV